MAHADKVIGVIMGTAPVDQKDGPVPGGPLEGVVINVSAAGMTYTIDSWDGGTYRFGPSPYPTYPVGVQTVPAAGDRCLVVFADTEPWVIGWWPRG